MPKLDIISVLTIIIVILVILIAIVFGIIKIRETFSYIYGTESLYSQPTWTDPDK